MFGWFQNKPKPLRLLAQSEEDVVPLSALLQDAALRGEDVRYDARARALTLRFNRFCHEHKSRTPLRAACALQIGSITGLQSRGFDVHRPPQGMTILHLATEPLEAPACHLYLRFAGKAAAELKIEVEAVDLLLMDLAAPHRARSTPSHPV
ncbi:DUF2948 family protein [Asticcacaulis sp. DW145]|jgi:hypothetical protein|uniref:DUF2948 family protein n=1 Tax=Asticcacaulis currens TaxID=2984210 RepID=A0ABT5IC41_9CAUL|nr:DUF2948 family protein [Asticcacaulis currens]MDC7693538.1 DUF2948 family protein [Asticcacaulis currens]BEV10492.1 DUF2948 family protein [Asticcacaulis sp. DW145]